MKVSVANGDRAHVFLDGHEAQFAIEADDEEGYVVQLVTNAEGRIQLNESQTAPLEERVYGQVRIERFQ
jgi:hypothetical protein